MKPTSMNNICLTTLALVAQLPLVLIVLPAVLFPLNAGQDKRAVRLSVPAPPGVRFFASPRSE